MNGHTHGRVGWEGAREIPRKGRSSGDIIDINTIKDMKPTCSGINLTLLQFNFSVVSFA